MGSPTSAPEGETPTRKAKARVAPGPEPAGNGVEPKASVTVLSTKDYSVIDTLQFKVKGARDSDITPVGITMTRDGKRAFVALGRANHVAFVDVATRKVTDQVLAAPIFQQGFICGVGPRVAEAAAGLIQGFPYSAPAEDLKLK